MINKINLSSQQKSIQMLICQVYGTPCLTGVNA